MPPTDPRSDPRRTITQEAFSVAPELLGLPLARPSRRLFAILLDLLFVAFLVNVGGAVLFGIAAAFAFFRIATRKLGKGGSFFGKTARLALRGAGTLILFGVAVSTWDRVGEAMGEDETKVAATVETAPGAAAMTATGTGGVVTAARLVDGIRDLRNATDTASARAAAERVVREMRKAGASDADIREAVADAAEDGEKEWIPGAVAGVLPAAPRPASPVAPESLAVLYAGAAGHDPAAADTLGARLGSVLARDSLNALRGEVGELKGEVRELRAAEKESEESGLLGTLLRLLDDLGIGFGWNALYFTAFTALWKGRTPGKRLLGIRVMRLNGQPMTLWSAFERFGGYAAGVLTGLLGFAQVYWDRNRQAIHDKITETVVIRDRGAPLPRPAAAPGGAGIGQGTRTPGT